MKGDGYMKKLLAVLTALTLVLTLASCGKKETAENVNDIAATNENLAGVININTQEAWQEKFPDAKIFSFTVHYAEYETGEYEELYFCADGGNLSDWVNTPFNLTGWFVYDGMIVSADGQYAIKNPAPLSENAVYEAEKLEEKIIA